MSESGGLINVYRFDQTGNVQEIGWDEIGAWEPEQGALWVHLDRRAEETHRWLAEESALDPIVSEALLAEETRARVLRLGDSLLVILRGVNLNPGSEPEDMVSIRLWFDAHRIISLQALRLLAVDDIRQSLARGEGPRTPGDFLPEIAAGLIGRMSPVLEAIDDEIDETEAELIESQSSGMRRKLGALRRQAISLRRYLSPQRDALIRLSTEQLSWLSDHQRARLREVADRVTRYIEDLDAARERAAVTQDELVSRLSEQMNQTMYVLSLVAALFLPLGFLTGLLGINVGGIPGTQSEIAFAVVCLLILIIAGAELWLFRRRRWF